MKKFVLLLCVISSISYAQQDVEDVLDSFHQAAGEANFERYFSLLAKESVFLGTDATERWNKTAFKAFVKPYFDANKGWLYTPTERNVSIIETGKIAFFDELLTNASYGLCRGSGVLIKRAGQWKILQYNLTIPIPNGVSKRVVSIIGHNAEKK
ncbi:nuclear transport factor 2 family protein [Thalassotalea sediminis]|uniref:nuclear transport factor 2 family protein n=1 Tax=Thalassotalea sediminis TaxID=1759089 RepID=UPI002572ADED|nr:nuclear transport factor 2 family protein [Thalassotalea sediminis]